MNSRVFHSMLLVILFVSSSLFAQTEQVYEHPEWSVNSNIYEVNVRQLTEEGTFQGLIEHLPRLKKLGVEILWLMPIHPIGEKNRKGTLGSYYAVKDYLDVNPTFGTKDDFRELVKKAHEMDMYVILDWVANHTAWDNELTETNPEYFNVDSLGNFYPPVADWEDVIDLNYDNKELWEYMTDALVYWVEEFDVDGYRCDVAGMVPVEFWNQAREKLEAVKPVFMLAEDESPELHSAFDMTYDWKTHHIFNEIAHGEVPADSLVTLLKENEARYPESAYRMRFTSNHDENSWKGSAIERLGDATEVFAAVTGIMPGMMLIYTGQEAGNNKMLEFFEKDPVVWKEHKIAEVYEKLNGLKEWNEALWNGEYGGAFYPMNVSNPVTQLAFMREKGGYQVVGVFNLSDKEQIIDLDCEKLFGTYRELISMEEFNIEGEFEVVLGPWEYFIFHKPPIDY